MAGLTIAGLAAVICVGGILAPAATASVKTVHGIKYVREGFNTKKGKRFARFDASCPNGTHVLGGGAFNDADYGDLFVAQTYPIDDGWKVLLKSADKRKHSGRVYAICGKHKVRYPEQRFDVGPGTQGGEHNVACPGDTQILSGGIRGARKLIANSTFPVGDDAWGSYVDNHAGSEKRFTETAVCAKLETTVVDASSGPDVPPGQRVTDRAACPTKMHVYGGGFQNSGGFNGISANSLYPLNGAAKYTDWRTRQDNLSATFSFLHRAVVVCGPGL